MSTPIDPRARDRRAIAAGAIACVAILTFGRGLPALRSAERNAEHRLELARARLNRLQPPSATTGEYTRDSTTTALRYIRRQSVAEVTAELGRHVTTLARFSSVSIESVTPEQPGREADRSGPFVTAVTVSATGDAAAVLEYLKELELGTPVVGVTSLRLVRQGTSLTDDLIRVEATIRAVAEISRVTEAR